MNFASRKDLCFSWKQIFWFLEPHAVAQIFALHAGALEKGRGVGTLETRTEKEGRFQLNGLDRAAQSYVVKRLR